MIVTCRPDFTWLFIPEWAGLRFPVGTPVLFSRQTSNLDGRRPVSCHIYPGAIYRWLTGCIFCGTVTGAPLLLFKTVVGWRAVAYNSSPAIPRLT